MSYQQLGMSNQDAEWLASRRFTIEDIARMFNVSPIFLQEYSNSTYSNFSEGKPRISHHDDAPVAGEL
ncbi:putative head portal protein [Escherichia coli]|nr:putative head portal protein [Escherichia coli]